MASASSAEAGAEPQPPAINYVAGFLLVGIAWGLTTPFIRRAAKDHHPAAHPLLERGDVKTSWAKSKLYGAFFAVLDLLRNPRYAIPLLINLTGSVWFFLLIGQAGASSLPSGGFCVGWLLILFLPELSLTVPIVNTLAFLFTVLGDWWVDNKVISRGMFYHCLKQLHGPDLLILSKTLGSE